MWNKVFRIWPIMHLSLSWARLGSNPSYILWVSSIHWLKHQEPSEVLLHKQWFSFKHCSRWNSLTLLIITLKRTEKEDTRSRFSLIRFFFHPSFMFLSFIFLSRQLYSEKPEGTINNRRWCNSCSLLLDGWIILLPVICIIGTDHSRAALNMGHKM